MLLMVAGAAACYVVSFLAAHETLAVSRGDSLIDVGFLVARNVLVGGGAKAAGGFSEFGFSFGVVEVEERVADGGGFVGGLF